jgi:hypothetical protein
MFFEKNINETNNNLQFPSLNLKEEEEEEARRPRKQNEKHGGRIFSSNNRS